MASASAAPADRARHAAEGQPREIPAAKGEKVEIPRNAEGFAVLIGKAERCARARVRHECRDDVADCLVPRPVGERERRRAPVGVDRLAVIRVGVCIPGKRKAAQPAVVRPEPQTAAEHREALCRDIRPEEPRRIAVLLVQMAVRDVDVSAQREVVAPLEYHRTGVFHRLFLYKARADGFRDRTDGVLLRDRRAVNAHHALRGQEQRHIVQHGEGARRDSALALCALPQGEVGCAVLGHDEGARKARHLLCTAGLDDDLAFVLLEVARDGARLGAHARKASIGEIGGIV